MNNKLIDNIVWWIPFKNLRNFVREILILLLTFDKRLTELNKKISELDEKIFELNNQTSELDNRIIAVNNNISIFSDFENINKSENNKDKYEYNYIFSIGENCFTAALLRDNNLRKCSGPLDWLTPLEYSKINLISNLQLINNEFEDFFDKKYLSFVGKTDYKYSIYFDSNSHLYYPHDFKEGDNFDVEYDSVYLKYKNRINRTIDLLKDNNKVLMVYIEYYKLFNNLDIFNTITWLDNIRTKYKNNNIDLLYIKHSYFVEKDRINFKLIDNKLHLYILDNSFDYNYNNLSYYLHSWSGNVKNTSKILQRYKLIE